MEHALVIWLTNLNGTDVLDPCSFVIRPSQRILLFSRLEYVNARLCVTEATDGSSASIDLGVLWVLEGVSSELELTPNTSYGRLVRCDIPAPRSASSRLYAFPNFLLIILSLNND